MADLKMNVNYQLSLTRDEWNVVSKALRAYAMYMLAGNTPFAPEDEREIARNLQEQMVRQKHAVLEQMTGEAAKGVHNIEAEARKRGR